MANLHIAQINVGRTVAALDDPRMAGFVERLAEINALADRSPGFVWRLQSESGDATSIRAYEDPLVIVNVSVWETLEALHHYVYLTAHSEVLRQRKQWFEKFNGPYYALWWVAAGHRPTPQEGRERLEYLAAHGPSVEAFWFGAPFADVAAAPQRVPVRE